MPKITEQIYFTKVVVNFQFICSFLYLDTIFLTDTVMINIIVAERAYDIYLISVDICVPPRPPCIDACYYIFHSNTFKSIKADTI